MKIGIIGSDNSHGGVFAKALNIDNMPEYADVSVSHIWGTDAAETADKVQKGNIPHVAKTHTDMIDQVDAALLVLRHGGLHWKHAEAFLDARIPLFLDKPMTCSTADARKVIEKANALNVPISSFSTVRFDSHIQKLKKEWANFGDVRSGDVSGIITPNSAQYGGMIFYGIHITELMVELFGYGVEKIYATQNGNTIIAIASYPDKVITMHFMGDCSYFFSCTIHGKEKTIYQVADAGDYFVEGLKRIIHMFKTSEKPLSNAKLFETIAIHEAIDKSLASGAEVTVEKL
ncbi:Gfo/Idh/MocA family oxidoreductase [bacterium]|nr:Gfo/Idh/MocA family oxidoreductase [bacterium]